MEVRDWLAVAFGGFSMLASTGYLFMHPDVTSFGVWAGLMTGIATAYHIVVTWDQKRPDAP